MKETIICSSIRSQHSFIHSSSPLLPFWSSTYSHPSITCKQLFIHESINHVHTCIDPIYIYLIQKNKTNQPFNESTVCLLYLIFQINSVLNKMNAFIDIVSHSNSPRVCPHSHPPSSSSPSSPFSFPPFPVST